MSQKLSFHIRKELKLLDVSNMNNNDKSNLSLNLMERLIHKYKEYESYSSDVLKDSIEMNLQSIESMNTIDNLSSNSTSTNNNTNNIIQANLPLNRSKVMNLNQLLSQTYSRYPPNSMKRQRINNDTTTPNNITNNTTTTNEIEINNEQQNKKNKKLRNDNTNIEKSNHSSFHCLRPKARLSHLAGIELILSQIQELVFYPIYYSHLYQYLGVQSPCGILLHGPSGCGKTYLANAIAGELDLPFFKASGPELIGGTSGESEERIRELFDLAIMNSPCVLFIDALDVIAGKKESSQRGMDRRVVAQLFDSIDRILSMESTSSLDTRLDESKPNLVIFIAATNKPDSIDPGVRGRFSRELGLPVPDANSRTKILRLISHNMRLGEDVDFEVLGKLTPGFVGADLHTLVKEAGMLAVRRVVQEHIIHDNETIIELPMIPQGIGTILMEDLIQATKSIQPTAKREGFAVVPNVTWKDVGALAEVRDELLHNVLEPIANPEKFRRLGLEVPAGVLFFGPPGCGKTLLAKAIANQSGANFISVKGPELLNMYVGESESRVRQVFARARASSPCVIFFDELDALCPRRGSGGAEGSNVSERVVNQLLTELDGLEVRKDVYIIAATNRLELIDDAILRPGRLGKLLYVPLPNAADRISILQAIVAKNIATSEEEPIDMEAIATDKRAEGFTGADLASLVREAGLAVIKEMTKENENLKICLKHFEIAFTKVKPSVTPQDRIRYERVHSNIKQGMGAVQALQEAATFVKIRQS